MTDPLTPPPTLEPNLALCAYCGEWCAAPDYPNGYEAECCCCRELDGSEWCEQCGAS